jgi:N-acetylmuramoyl-L-alanine amidase
MLKKTIFLLPCFFIALALCSFSIPTPKAVRTIIIDPGHGGNDQGAAGLFSTEAQVTLSVGKKLGERIAAEMPGVRVLFTRTTDIFPGNAPTKKDGDRYRANFANNSKADLFVSIHCNSAGKAPGGWNEKRIVDYDEKVGYTGKGKKKKKRIIKVPVYETFYVANEAKGTETFIWAAHETSHKGEFVAEQAAEFASYDDTMPEDDPVVNALKLIYTKKYFFKSKQLAELVQQEFERSGRINRGVKQRNEKGIWVLHATGMPSVLVETGFISNKEEEQYLNSAEGQDEIVSNITAAIKAYLVSLDNPKKGTDEGEGQSSSMPNAAGVLNESRKTKAN